MAITRALILAAWVLCTCLVSCQHQAGPVFRVNPDAPTSWKALREEQVAMQKFDFSCGTASLATLMRYSFADGSAREKDLLADILEQMTPEQIEDRRVRGLSMLDLRNCARRRGYTADGYKLELPDLRQLTEPVVVHLTRDDVPHFAVLRGIRGDRAYLADPSIGNLTLRTSTFTREWTGYVLLLSKPGTAPGPVAPTHPTQAARPTPVPDQDLSIYEPVPRR